MLLKDQISIFEEVQDQSSALIDSLIGKYSVGIEKSKYFLLIFSVTYIFLLDE